MLAQATPMVEQERIGVELNLGGAVLQDFKPLYGGGVDLIFITDDRIGAALGVHLLRNSGESIYKEREPGTELVSATSSRYFTMSGLELDYVLLEQRLTPYTGAGIHWFYFHEQSRFIYYAPGWKITTWKNFQGNGFCISATIGFRYLIKSSIAMVIKTDLLWGKFDYPPLGDDIHIRGLALSLGIRL